MSKSGSLMLAAVAVALALGTGYWLGRITPPPSTSGEPSAKAAARETPAAPAKKLLYYRNPMGLPDTSPTPKKDPMGMDYIAVYEGEEPATGGSDIKVSADRVQKLGVRVETVIRRDLVRVVRAVGRVEPDERRTYSVAPKFEGWVEKLHVNATGQPVARGDALFEAYSPELVSAQREYAIAARGVDMLKEAPDEAGLAMRQLAESSLMRLRNWDVPDDQVQALARGGELRRTLTFRSPVGGIVMEKKALQGMRFMPGEALYQIADLSALWVIADVFEQDLALVRHGQAAQITINAYPERRFQGRVTYVYPSLTVETRTVPVRIELANPGGALKPGMYASVELAAAGRRQVVAVPHSAVIDSGVRQIVLVQTGEGRFAPREVKLGARTDDHVEVIDGVREGESVVVTANFLIDAESNLKAAIGGLATTPAAGGAAPAGAAPAPPGVGGKVGHQASGTLDAIDARSGTVTVTHGPVESLGWPGMTMDFALANSALVANLKPGTPITIEFVERKPGEYVITRVAPARIAGTAGVSGKAANPHAGH